MGLKKKKKIGTSENHQFDGNFITNLQIFKLQTCEYYWADKTMIFYYAFSYLLDTQQNWISLATNSKNIFKKLTSVYSKSTNFQK